MQTLTRTTFQLISVVAVLSLALGINYLYAATWTGPTATAPGNNTPAPLNVSTSPQVKDGNLSVGSGGNSSTTIGLSIYGANVVKGWQRIGDTNTPTQLLDLSGGRSGTDGIKFPDGTVQTTAGGAGSLPTGAIMAFYLSTCPSGWKAADGTSGTPDLRGQFVRGLSNGSTTDSGRTLGSSQGDAIRNITGTIGPIDGVYTGPFGPSYLIGYGGTLNSQGSRYVAKFDTSLVVPTASENRPVNVALLYCYKT